MKAEEKILQKKCSGISKSNSVRNIQRTDAHKRWLKYEIFLKISNEKDEKKRGETQKEKMKERSGGKLQKMVTRSKIQV